MPACAGIGLRAQHHAAVVAERPAVGWLEAHSENYFGRGSQSLHWLLQAREHYPVALHGVGLSLGSTDPLDTEHLREWRRLIVRVQPAVISEHLSWSSIDGRFSNDLLPLPYTREALAHLVDRVDQVQELLGRRILIENLSSYLQFDQSDMPEWVFLAELSRASGCGILLDVNNIYVNAHNHGFDADAYLAALPREAVGEIHLAGHSVRELGGQTVLIDTHSTHVCADVWQLYAQAIARFGAQPTLLEWDADIPALEVLVAEAQRADQVAGEALAAAA
ncbi:MAG: DUF692 domain-containing protein [Proteobacteria bacterium]|nr:DUF692 domain-containing protein [Pseudomonadota bacterium]